MITGTGDRRDIVAVQRLATAFCKLLFPHGQMSDQDFSEYCLKSAISLRQGVRDQLALLDPEYSHVKIGSA